MAPIEALRNFRLVTTEGVLTWERVVRQFEILDISCLHVLHNFATRRFCPIDTLMEEHVKDAVSQLLNQTAAFSRWPIYETIHFLDVDVVPLRLASVNIDVGPFSTL
jgi:hypothetical protein